MPDIIDEVIEDVKQDTFFSFLKKYGKYLILLSLIMICTTAIYVYIEQRNTNKQESLSLEYHNFLAISDKNSTEYKDAFDKLLKNKNNIYTELAIFERADNLNSQKKHEEAISLLLEYGVPSKHKEISDLSKLRVAEFVNKYGLHKHREKAIDLLKHTGSKSAFKGSMKLALAQALVESNKKEEAIVVLKDLIDDKSSADNTIFFAHTMLNSIQN